MKKCIGFCVCLCMIIGLFPGRSGGMLGSDKNDRSGKEIAKLMLANQNLNADDFNGSDKIMGLSPTASGNQTQTVAASKLSASRLPVSNLVASSKLSFKPVASHDPSAYAPYSNMVEFFNSYIVNIVSSANRAAEEIDLMKKNVSFTDVWIGDPETGATMLLVDAGVETLVTSNEAHISVCRRYTDENAYDVYEMIQAEKAEGLASLYMLYSPDQRYEISIRWNSTGTNGLYMVIEKSRGYWNMFVIYSAGEESMNMQTLVSTGDSAFVYDGTVTSSGYTYNWSTFIDPTLSCDLVSTYGHPLVSVYVNAVDGISSFETNSYDTITSFTAGGTTVSEKEFLPNSTVMFTSGASISVSSKYASLDFMVDEGLSQQAAIEQVRDALSSMGITFRYDISSVTENINGAMEIAQNFDTHYSWNGYKMDSYANVTRAIDKDTEKYQELYQVFEAVKDNKQLTSDSRGFSFADYDFATVSSLSGGTVTFADGKVTVDGLSMQIENLKVLDAEQAYTVHLALARLDNDSAAKNTSGFTTVSHNKITIQDMVPLAGTTDADYIGAIIMDAEGAKTTTYSSGNSFTLSQSASFTLPDCTEAGVYTVVAYVATDDGIRVSEMVPLPFSSDVTYVGATASGLTAEMRLNSDRELIAVYSAGEYRAVLDAKESYTYDEVEKALAELVLLHGYPLDDAIIEVYDPNTDTGTAANPSATFSACICRIPYTVKADNTRAYAYVVIGDI